MIATKSDMNACYKATKQLDEAEAVLLQAIDIMASMCSRDIYNALDKLKDRRDEFETAILRFRKGAQEPSLPGSVSEYLDGRREQLRSARLARMKESPADRFLESVRRADSEEPWWNETRRRSDAGVEELRSDLTEAAFEAVEAS